MPLQVGLILLLSRVIPAHGQRLVPAADRRLAPPLDLPQVAGPTVHQASTKPGRLTSAAFAGKVLVVDIWSPGCVPCGPVHEALAALAPSLSDRGVTILSIGLADTADARSWVTEHGGAPFPVALMTPELF